MSNDSTIYMKNYIREVFDIVMELYKDVAPELISESFKIDEKDVQNIKFFRNFLIKLKWYFILVEVIWKKKYRWKIDKKYTENSYLCIFLGLRNFQVSIKFYART